MSERLCSTSYDLNKVPRADAVVRLCADQIEYLGQRKVAKTLRGIETQIAAKLEAAKDSAVDIDSHSEKVTWIRQLENLRPKWLVFFLQSCATNMNKKRKILTVVALAVFGAIILFHYGSIRYERKHNYDYVEEVGDTDWIIQRHGKILWRAPFLDRNSQSTFFGR